MRTVVSFICGAIAMFFGLAMMAPPPPVEPDPADYPVEEPVAQVVEKPVEQPKPEPEVRYVDRVVEVPVERVVEKIVEKPVYIQVPAPVAPAATPPPQRALSSRQYSQSANDDFQRMQDRQQAERHHQDNQRALRRLER